MKLTMLAILIFVLDVAYIWYAIVLFRLIEELILLPPQETVSAIGQTAIYIVGGIAVAGMLMLAAMLAVGTNEVVKVITKRINHDKKN